MADLKVLYVSSECSPFAKTGGLGDVVGALPKAVHARGVDARVIIPLYKGISWDDLDILDGVLSVPVGYGHQHARLRRALLPSSDVPIYFLEHHEYFDRAGIYGDSVAFEDNLDRFTFLCRGALVGCRALDWVPDVIHAHDWQAALIPVFADTVERDTFGATATVFTVHNLAHQGVFARDAFPTTGLGWASWDTGTFEHDDALNLMKAGLTRATFLSTVSPTYAREIQGPEQGRGLDYVLRARSADLVGVLNGIDGAIWNPARDPHLAAPFDRDDLTGKATCKRALQAEVGLPVRGDVPLFGVIARLDPQKGLDVLAEAIPAILDLDIQLVILGSGASDLEASFALAAARRPDRMATRVGFNDVLAHRIEGGADYFLMPSRFEPCGLNQLYSLRYGTLPIVRTTGGLADTVISFDEVTGSGTGFAFHDLHPRAVYDVVAWATWAWYERRKDVEAMRLRAMAQDFTWERSAEIYHDLYASAVSRRRGG